MRYAAGGIHIKCSTYSRIRTMADDLTVLVGDALSKSQHFAFLRLYGEDLDRLPKNQFRLPAFSFEPPQAAG